MSVKITDLPADTSVGGSELIPVDDAGTAKSMTPADISAYIIDNIEAIVAGTVVAAADKLYLLDATDSALKPVAIETVLQHAIDTIWGKAAEASPDDADVMALKDGGSTEKTVTLAVLAEYVRDTIEAAILDVSDLSDGSGTLAAADYLLVTQGTTAKRIQVSDITALIYASLATTVTALSAVTSTADADTFYVLQGGTAKKVTLAQILAHAGAAVTGTGTTNKLAQWASSSTVQAGPSVLLGATGFTAGSDSEVPTSLSVRNEMDEIINDSTDIGADLSGADTFLVDDGAAGTQRKSTLARVLAYVNKRPINDQTGTTYTLALLDSHVRLTNGAAITLTVPPNASVAFPIGTTITFIQGGAGTVTVAEGAAVTVNKASSFALAGQWSAATLVKVDTDVWDLFGDLT